MNDPAAAKGCFGLLAVGCFGLAVVLTVAAVLAFLAWRRAARGAGSPLPVGGPLPASPRAPGALLPTPPPQPSPAPPPPSPVAPPSAVPPPPPVPSPPSGAPTPLAGSPAPPPAPAPAPAPASASTWGRITFLSGPLAGQSFPVPDDGLWIGRDGAAAQVVVADSGVSKRHLWIGPRDGRVLAIDPGSTNGTFVGAAAGQRISERPLAGGDVVVLGADTTRLRYDDGD